MVDQSTRRKGVAFNIAGIAAAVIGWLVGGAVGIFFLAIGAGFIIGVLAGKIVRTITLKSGVKNGVIAIVLIAIVMGALSSLMFGLLIGIFVGLLLPIVILVYNVKTEDLLEHPKSLLKGKSGG